MPRSGMIIPDRGTSDPATAGDCYLSIERRVFFNQASAASHAFFRLPCEASPKYALALGREPPSVIL